MTTPPSPVPSQQEVYNPWLNPEDPDKCLFVSVHGYGKKERSYVEAPGGWFYPGSGETTDCPIPSAEANANATSGPAAASPAAAAGAGAMEEEGVGGERRPEGAEEGPGVTSAAEREVCVGEGGQRRRGGVLWR